MTAAAELLAVLRSRGWSVAVAESLTGGLVCSTIVDVPGASASLRGGVVAYATDLKATVLGVGSALLAARGPVDPEVARQMAEAVRERLGADVGLATTGVAGPDPQDGHPPGTVHVAVAAPIGAVVRSLRVPGDRSTVRSGAVDAVLRLALEYVRHEGEPEGVISR
ncbi:CinA family protein [Cellulomonas sp. URHD0024]|uniref:CinA family protein n=1 Tax=Cellulomonas sp. URHD0024 TaxID=1302620 RepID=UPI00041C364B|nr:CinA family protein [Cellulomonas sp. URHD0024]